MGAGEGQLKDTLSTPVDTTSLTASRSLGTAPTSHSRDEGIPQGV